MKKLIITTTCENCDEEFIHWYLKRLKNEEVMPGSTVIAEELEECGHAVFVSKDPTSPVVATTCYEIKEAPQKSGADAAISYRRR